MAYKYEAPFIDPKKGDETLWKGKQKKRKKKTKKKKKIRKKKIRVLEYAIDSANLISSKLRDKQYRNLDEFPVDENGQFITCSFEDVIKMIQEKIREKYENAHEEKEKPNHQYFIASALDEIGCFDYWSRGRIFSYLSKLSAQRRKEKKEVAKNRILNEARQAELALMVSEKQ